MTSTTPNLTDLDALCAEEPFVRALARSLLFDDSAADDVVQQTWIEALRRGIPAASERRGWLARVVRTRASNLRRGEARRAARERSAARVEAVASPAEMLERAEQRRSVVSAVASLPEPYRTAIMLRYFESHEPSRMSALLQVPLETVSTRLKRARAMLRDRLDSDHGGDRRAWMLALVPLASARTAARGAVMAKLFALIAAVSAMKALLVVLAVVTVSLLLRWAWIPSGDAIAPEDVAASSLMDRGTTTDMPEATASGDRAEPTRRTVESESTLASGGGERQLGADQRAVLTGILVEPSGRAAAQRACRLLCVDPVDSHPGAFEPGVAARAPGVSSLDVTTDSTGRFTFSDIPAGQAHALWLGHGGPHATLRTLAFELPAGRTTDLGTIALEPRGSIVGRLVDGAGTPIAGATVRAIDVPGALLSLAPIDRLSEGGALFCAVPDPQEFLSSPDGARAYAEAMRKVLGKDVPQADEDCLFAVLPFPAWLDHAFHSLPVPGAVTGSDGRFRIHGLLDADHALMARAPGFASLVRARVTVRAGEERDAGDLRMSDGECLSLRVVDTDHRPVAGAEVRIALRPRLGLTGVLFADPARTTGADGRVVFDGLPRADFAIAFRRAQDAHWNTEPPLGSGTEAELVLPARREILVEVRGPAGAVPSEPQFTLWDGPPIGEVTASGLQTAIAFDVDRTDAARGNYRLRGLEPGIYTLGIGASGFAFEQRLIEMSADSDLAPLHVELRGGIDCEVAVVDEEGRAIRGAEVFVLADGDSRAAFSQSVLFQSGGFNAWPRLARGGVMTDARGLARIDQLPEGPAQVLVRHRVRGSTALRVEPLAAKVTVTLVTPGTITGTLRSAGMVVDPTSVELLARPLEPENGSLFPVAPHGVRLGPDGSFTIEGLAPGRFELSARPSIEEPIRSVGGLLQRANPADWTLPNRNGRTEVVVVRSGVTEQVVLDLDPLYAGGSVAGGTVRGRVEIDGIARAGVPISASFPYDSVFRADVHFAETDVAGRFARSSVSNKRFDLVVQLGSDPIAEWRRWVGVDDGAAMTVDFVARTAPLSLRVLGSDGSPAANAVVELWGNLDDESSYHTQVNCGAMGTVAVRVPLGSYSLRASCADGEILRRDLVITTGLEVELRVTGDGTLRGRIENPSGRSIRGVLLRQQVERGSIAFTSLIGGEVFQFTNLEPGRYSFELFTEDGNFATVPPEVEIPPEGRTTVTLGFGAPTKN